jgi:F-type H+-transporting ATPase subunit b
VPQEEPKKAAQSILDAIPGNSLVSKTAILSAGTGLSIAAISNELYVVNEESIIMISLLTIYWAVAKYAGPAYKAYAEDQTAKIRNILQSARDNHTEAVKERIEDVKQLGGVVDITKTLFEVSKVRNGIQRLAVDLYSCHIGNRQA